MTTLDLQTQYLALQNALADLPHFDGRKPSLRTFVYDVENAKGLLPKESEEELFVRGVIAKLKGAAKDCVDGHKFNKIEDLLRHLKGHFSSGRDFKTYHQELAKIAMLPDENVSEYGARVQHLVRGARAALADSRSEEEIKRLLELINPIDCFVDGLPPDLEQRVSAKRPKDLNSAIELAREEERRAFSRKRTRETAVRYSRRDFSPNFGSSPRGMDGLYDDNPRETYSQYHDRANLQRQSGNPRERVFRESSPYYNRSPARYGGRSPSPSSLNFHQRSPSSQSYYSAPDCGMREHSVKILNREHPDHPACPSYPRGNREPGTRNVTWSDRRSLNSAKAPFCAFCNDLGHETARCRNPSNPQRAQSPSTSIRAFSPSRVPAEPKHEASGHLNSQGARRGNRTASAPVKIVRVAAAATQSDARNVIPAAQLSKLRLGH